MRAPERSTHFPGGRRHPQTPLEENPFHAIPLRTPAASPQLIGLLLACTADSALEPEIRWLADVLSDKLARIREGRVRSDVSLDLERRQLFLMLNAVTDPILLTDPTGKLLLANTHAERLFAAHAGAERGPPPRRLAQQSVSLVGAGQRRRRRVGRARRA